MARRCCRLSGEVTNRSLSPDPWPPLPDCCHVMGPVGHMLGKEDEEMWVLKSAGAPVSGEGSSLWGLALAHVGPSKPDSPSLLEKGKAQWPEGRAKNRQAEAYKSTGQRVWQGWPDPSSDTSCMAWADEFSPLSLSFLICKSMSITILTLPGHCKDSVKIMYEAVSKA